GAPDHQIVLLQMDLADRLPATSSGLYGSMLRRAETTAATILNEQRHQVTLETARNWVRCLSESIAISREGWREQDLRAVLSQVTGLPWSDLLFASIRRAYRGHLVQRGTSGERHATSAPDQWTVTAARGRNDLRQLRTKAPPGT